MLDEFDETDLRLFLKFVWGRTQLPPAGSPKWGEGFKVTPQFPQNDTGLPRPDIDGSLPRAHTCFFQIDLPWYSSVAVMRDRVLFAIRNCITVSMA